MSISMFSGIFLVSVLQGASQLSLKFSRYSFTAFVSLLSFQENTRTLHNIADMVDLIQYLYQITLDVTKLHVMSSLFMLVAVDIDSE